MRSSRVWNLLLIAAMLLAAMATPGVSVAAPAASDPSDALSKIESLVLDQIAAEGQTEFFVWMVEKADLSPADQLQTKQEKGRFVFNALVETAERTQKDLRDYLDAQRVDYQAFYIANKILVQGGGEALAMDLAARADVERITANHPFQLEEPFDKRPAPEGVTAIEPNITFINADDVWTLGYDGEGTVMAGNDTGLDWDHPALINQYRGWDGVTADHNYNWWDATGTYPNVPGDGHGHGTHTTGTMVGDDGGANQIGVAPGAQTVHCKNMTDSGSGSEATFTECFQWDLAPWDLNGQNPNPDMAPDAINNSWGHRDGNQNQYRDEIQALHAAGILVEVSAGNEGSSCQTLRSPADYWEVLTTGSVDHSGGVLPGTLSGFSSRGPSSLDPGYYFPDIMAPGENIRSSVPGGGYEGGWSGTSMAGPHATALVGLIWSACPTFVGRVEDTIQLIQDTAVPLTGQPGSSCGGDYTDGPNNDWGFGTIDALAAVEAVLAQCGGLGTLDGHVYDSSTSLPLEDAVIDTTLSPTQTWQTGTDDQGCYQMTVLTGTYTVEAWKFGYIPDQVMGVDVYSGTTTTADFYLDPAPSALVYGNVTDANTGWPLHASINIAGYPDNPVWTDPATGYYEVSLPEGSVYNFQVEAWVAGYLPQDVDVGPVMGNMQEDFALDVDVATCEAPSYSPSYSYLQDFETDDGSYTHSGAYDEWEWGMPTTWPGSCASGDYCWGTDLDGNYENYADNELVSVLIDLSSVPPGTPLVAKWWQAWHIESDSWDHAYAEVSIDGGPWTQMWSHTGSTAQVDWTEMSYDISAAAGSDVQFRWRMTTDSIVYYSGYYIDLVSISSSCDPAAGGLVVGYVYDLNTSDPLDGADVWNETEESMVTGADGFYTLFSPPGLNDYWATAAGYETVMETVDVADGATTQWDFYLGTGYLEFTPPALEATLNMGDNTTVPALLENSGTGDAYFEMQEVDGGFQPNLAVNSQYAYAEIVYWDETETSPDDFLYGIQAWGSGASIPSGARYRAGGTTCDGQTYYIFGGGASSGVVLNESWKYDPAADTWTQLANMPVALMNFEATCIGEDIYLVGGYTGLAHTNNFQVYNIATDSWTATTWPNARTPMTAAWGDKLYAFGGNPGPSAETWMYDPGSDTWTQLSSMPTANSYGAGITVGDYIYQIGGGLTATVQRYDPSTDVWDSSGPQLQDSRMSALTIWYGDSIYVASGGGSGGDVWTSWPTTEVYDPSMWPGGSWVYDDENVPTPAVAMAGDCADDRIWGAGGTSGGTYYDINQYLDDGLSCNLGRAFDVPWLSEDPISGTISVGDMQPIDVTFDAGAVPQPGEYYATLKVNNDTVYGPLYVPVTLTVPSPDTWGKLTGVVAGLGHCDADTYPLQGADVVVVGEITVTTDADGVYGVWLQEGVYTVEAYADEHLSASAVVTITAQMTTEKNLELRSIQPCMSVTPDSMSVALLSGDSWSQMLTLVNDGAGPSAFAIRETTQTLSLLNMGAGPIALVSDGSQLTAITFVLDEMDLDYDVWNDNDPNYYMADPSFLNNYGLIIWYASGSDGTGRNITQVEHDATEAWLQAGGNLLATGYDTLGSPDDPLMAALVRSSSYGDGPFTYDYQIALDHPITNGPHGVYPPGYGISADTSDHDQAEADTSQGAVTVAEFTSDSHDKIIATELASGGRVVYWNGNQNVADWLTTLSGIEVVEDKGMIVAAPGNPASVDGQNLFKNALSWLTAGGDVKWLDEDPTEGMVALDSTFDVEVTFTALPTLPLGIYMATLLVDTDDAVNSQFQVPVQMEIVECVEVSDVAPSVLNTDPIYPGDLVELKADIMPDNFTGSYSYTIDYDDGMTDEDNMSSDDPLLFDHTYADAGTYLVEVAAWNCDMAEPVVGTVEVVVEPVPCTEVVTMTLSMLTPYPIYMGDMVGFEADIVPDDFASPLSYTIDYGDGMTQEGSTSDNPMAFSHAFVDSGTMRVQIQIWNCGMEVPVSDWMDVEVAEPMFYIYLPVVVRDSD